MIHPEVPKNPFEILSPEEKNVALRELYNQVRSTGMDFGDIESLKEEAKRLENSEHRKRLFGRIEILLDTSVVSDSYKSFIKNMINTHYIAGWKLQNENPVNFRRVGISLNADGGIFALVSGKKMEVMLLTELLQADERLFRWQNLPGEYTPSAFVLQWQEDFQEHYNQNQ